MQRINFINSSGEKYDTFHCLILFYQTDYFRLVVDIKATATVYSRFSSNSSISKSLSWVAKPTPLRIGEERPRITGVQKSPWSKLKEEQIPLTLSKKTSNKQYPSYSSQPISHNLIPSPIFLQLLPPTVQIIGWSHECLTILYIIYSTCFQRNGRKVIIHALTFFNI